ncbi:MAG: UDPGP type 1 family protein [Verrucomicrobiae bacterium]|nr:UDPGP type 1 family protein [Verrucomicrobiae bacterium]
MIHPRNDFEDAGQGQVFRFFDDLPAAPQDALTREASGVDLSEVSRLHETLVRNPGAGNEALADELQPAEFIPLPRNGGDAARWEEAFETGEAALRAGRVAAFTVAGGQGTRLGFDGPKGTFPVTPIRKAPLFQVFAEKIRAASNRYGKPMPWYIMTSVINHEETVDFFERHGYFGLGPDRVHFFSQGLMPAVDEEGKILLAEKGRIALSPDGHGGSLRALVRSGAIDRMEADGIDTISYFQVDNPLVRCLDPAFIGFHLLGESEMSSKALPKAYPEEKVGVFCRNGEGRDVVIEYSDMPERLATERDDDGQLRFRAGSIAIHVFDRDFVKRLGAGDDPDAVLPFHKAHKKVAFVDDAGKPVEPDSPNAWKFEMFVFDALPFAKNPVIIETAREDDFSPVKNAEGADSPKTCREDQLRQFARWAKAAGLPVEADKTGLPSVAFEITPGFADTEERFVERVSGMGNEKPVIVDEAVIDDPNP